MQNLAGCYAKNGEVKDAINLYEQCLAIEKISLGNTNINTNINTNTNTNILGDGHPYTIMCMATLANLYSSNNNNDNAKEMLTACIGIIIIIIIIITIIIVIIIIIIIKGNGSKTFGDYHPIVVKWSEDLSAIQ